MKNTPSRKLICLLLLVGLMFCIPLISSAPPVTQVQQYPEGYVIVESTHEYLKQNQDYQYNFFVYNASTGILLDNTSITCTFFLANSSGEVLVNEEVHYFADGHWGIDILKGNFSSVQYYPYGVSCQDGRGGSLAGVFEVTPTGNILETSQSIIFSLIYILVVAILMFGIYGLTRASEVSWQIFYICLTYIMMFCLFFISWLVVSNYLHDIPIITSIFWIIWLILAICFWPFIIGVSGYLLKLQAEALMVQEYQKQGFSKEDSRELAKTKKNR